MPDGKMAVMQFHGSLKDLQDGSRLGVAGDWLALPNGIHVPVATVAPHHPNEKGTVWLTTRSGDPEDQPF